MRLNLSAPNALAITFWSCLGCGLLTMFEPRSDAAWYAALVVLLGQFVIATARSSWRSVR